MLGRPHDVVPFCWSRFVFDCLRSGVGLGADDCLTRKAVRPCSTAAPPGPGCRGAPCASRGRPRPDRQDNRARYWARRRCSRRDQGTALRGGRAGQAGRRVRGRVRRTRRRAALRSVNSGTAAPVAALLTLGIGRGDEVIVPSFSFAATAGAAALAGATPVFADIDPAAFCLDPAPVAATITPRTAAVIPVHLYGQPAPMDAIVPRPGGTGWPSSRTPPKPTEQRWTTVPSARSGPPPLQLLPHQDMATIEGGMVATPDPASPASCGCCATRAWTSVPARDHRHERSDERCRAQPSAGSSSPASTDPPAPGDATPPLWTPARRRDQPAHRPPSAPSTSTTSTPSPFPAAPRPGCLRRARWRKAGSGSGSTTQSPSTASPLSTDTKPGPAEHRPGGRQRPSLPVHPALTTADIDRITTAVLGAHRKALP